MIFEIAAGRDSYQLQQLQPLVAFFLTEGQKMSGREMNNVQHALYIPHTLNMILYVLIQRSKRECFVQGN